MTEQNIQNTTPSRQSNWAEIDRLEAELEAVKMPHRKKGGMKFKQILGNTTGQIFLSILSIIWIIPLFYLILHSFREEPGAFSTRFFPRNYTLQNYVRLFTEEKFPIWLKNTLWISIWSCLLTTLFVLMVAYAFSRIRFKARKPIMNVMLILGMFPGFMSMTAIYFLLQAIFGKSQPDRAAISLILVYAGGAAMSYYVAKGFFDTVPKSLDEAARIDGASRFRIFRKIILPLSKPIVIYTILISFIAPWCDFIFASLITGTNQDNWTVAVGMRNWVAERANLNVKFTVFCAAAVVVAVPITALFMWLQKYYVQGVTGGAVKG